MRFFRAIKVRILLWRVLRGVEREVDDGRFSSDKLLGNRDELPEKPTISGIFSLGSLGLEEVMEQARKARKNARRITETLDTPAHKAQ